MLLKWTTEYAEHTEMCLVQYGALSLKGANYSIRHGVPNLTGQSARPGHATTQEADR